jgi:mannose-6-phosphate isomerase
MTLLLRREIEKPWGRTALPAPFAASGGRRIGEIAFAAPEGERLPLLVKYIFTSERLSIQVHPDDDAARARGLANGKSECWYVLDAEPGALLGLGPREPVDAARLRQAAEDGSIVDLLDWKPARAGDFFDVPAGTVHAIGPGLALVELQQHSDTTYRLYDYGRPRLLHLDDAIAVASRARYPESRRGHAAPDEEKILLAGPLFSLVHIPAGEDEVRALADRPRWAIPLSGSVRAQGEEAQAGDCLLVAPGASLSRAPGTRLLLAAEGAIAR